jgi:hypothetical protein
MNKFVLNDNKAKAKNIIALGDATAMTKGIAGQLVEVSSPLPWGH